MYIRHAICLFLSAGVVSCLAEQSAKTADTATSDLRASAVPAEANSRGRSNVGLTLWRADVDTGLESFWPAGARTVQLIITRGDAGDAATDGSPTVYAWIVKDGTTIYKVWRVAISQWGGSSGFHELFDQFSESQEDLTGASGVILGSIKTPGPKGPPIGPGGHDGFTQRMVNQVLSTAREINNLTNVTAEESTPL